MRVGVKDWVCFHMCFTGWYGHVCALVHSEGMGTYVHNLIMTHDKGNNYIAFMGWGIGSVSKSIFCERMRTWVQWILTNRVKVGHDYIQAYNPSAGGRKGKKRGWLKLESLATGWVTQSQGNMAASERVGQWCPSVTSVYGDAYISMHGCTHSCPPHKEYTIAFVFHLLSLCILCIVWFIFNVRCMCVYVCSCVCIYNICAVLDPGSNI